MDKMISTNSVNVKNAIEDFLKIEYTEGLINEFNVMDALINTLKKDTITGKYRHKVFALGITDNIRALGQSNDTYQLGLTDYQKGAETVEATFDTTKLMGLFSITDEVILKGTTDGSIFDIVKDNLSRMQLGLKHTMNRYTYGSKTGKIGVVSALAAVATDADGHDFYELSVSNSYSVLPGMGLMITWTDTTPDPDVTYKVQGRVYQKYSASVGAETLVFLAEEVYPANSVITEIPADAVVYARQLRIDESVKAEYTGLEDIIMTQNNTIFGVDRNVVKTFNCTVEDLSNALLTESKLRDMADHIALTNSEGSNVDLVASNHKIISTIEKQMYQFKQYNIDSANNGVKLGRSEVMFDNYILRKDKYSRDKNVYLLDTKKVGELLRRDFAWLTNGREGVLERLDGTEIYEGIMTKYADMYIDSWKSHAAFKNAKETV